MASITLEFNNKSNLLFIVQDQSIIQTISATCVTHGNYNNEVVRLLNSKEPQDIDHVNSLIINVIKVKNLSIFKYLLSQGYKIDVLNDNKQTALHLIFYNDWYKTENLELVDLLANCISEINYTDSNGLDHLHIASAMGSLELVSYYLDKQEDVNALYVSDIKGREHDRSGFTPLHFAIFYCRLGIVNLLLERGANVNATDSFGRTPLHLAASSNIHFEGIDDLEIFKVLIKKQSNLNAKDNRGNTPLINIFYKEPKKLLDSLGECYRDDQIERQIKKFEFLMGFAPDVKVSNNNGDTILHCIINDLNRLRRPRELSKITFDDGEHLQMLNQLLTVDETIDVNAKNNQGETPLQLAVMYMSTEVVKFLLECSADLSNLKFDFKNPHFFRYHDVVPDLVAIIHLLGVVESLENKEFEFTMEDNLSVLKFLVHEHEDCKCLDDSFDSNNVIFKIINLLKCGSATHIKPILKKIEDELKNENTLVTRCDRRLLYIAFYKKYIECADFYIDKEVKEAIDRLLQANNISQDGSTSEKMRRNVDYMKSTFLNDSLNVYDVITQHPYKIYDCVFDEKFDYTFFNLDNFPGYATFISGHFAKSLVRNYVEKLADDYLEALFPLQHPLFYETIIKYLNNKDILNVAIAVAANDA